MKTKYGLPPKVQFCTRCTMSNQRPVPVGEMKYKVNAYKPTDAFNKEGLCAACQFSIVKDNKIDWDKREKELTNVGLTLFVDPETGYKKWINTSSLKVRETYRNNALLREHYSTELFKKSNVDFTNINIQEGYIKPLMQLFKKR